MQKSPIKDTLFCKRPIVLSILPIVATPIPLMEEIRLKIFGSQDLTVFLLDLLSDGDSVYTGGKLV